MKWLASLEARWRAWWPELEPREQRMILIAAMLVALALAWWVALAPARPSMRASTPNCSR